MRYIVEYGGIDDFYPKDKTLNLDKLSYLLEKISILASISDEQFLRFFFHIQYNKKCMKCFVMEISEMNFKEQKDNVLRIKNSGKDVLEIVVHEEDIGMFLSYNPKFELEIDEDN